MAKFTYKEIKEIINDTPADMKNKEPREFNAVLIGAYKHTAANWWYQVYMAIHDGRPVLCVAVFGWIK